MATVGQRIKAAQARAGMSVSQIAAEDGRPARFSAKTIGRVIRGERDLEPHEADWLAKVLGVPADSFAADPPSPAPLDRDAIARRLDAIDQRLDELLGLYREVLQHRSEQGSEIIDNLTMLNDTLKRADESAHRLEVASERAGRVLRGDTPRLAPAARKPSPKRSPRASKPKPS